MILDIDIKNYRSFKDETNFSLIAESSKSKDNNVFLTEEKNPSRLLKTAMIFGANASGKSNILRALFDIRNLICGDKNKAGDNIPAYDPFILNTETENLPVEFSITFIGKDKNKYKYEISFNSKNIYKEELSYFPKGRERMLFTRKTNSESTIHKGKLGKDFKNEEIDIFHNQTILSKFGEDIPNELLTNVYLYFKDIDIINACSARRIHALRSEITTKVNSDKNLHNKLKELFIHADTGLVGLNVSENSTEDKIFSKDISENAKSALLKILKYDVSGVHKLFEKEELIGSRNIPLEEESHGTNRLYSLGGKILEALEKGSPLFIDEICTGLHLYLIKLLVMLFQNERINSKNAQLIFTTHNPNLLDKTMFRRDQIWFTEKNKFGESELFCLYDFPDVREDTPFDKWYLAGKFGGIPNLKSIESLFLE